MQTIEIKGKIEEDRKINGELVVRTDNNVPYGTGKTIVISEDVVDYYQNLYNNDPDYWKTTNISYIRILKVADYVARTKRGFEEKGGFDRLLPIDMLIEYENTVQAMKDSVDEAKKEDSGSSGLIIL